MGVKHLLSCFYVLSLAFAKPIHPALDERQILTFTINPEPLQEITSLLTDLPNPTDIPTRFETFDIPPSLQCLRVVRATIGTAKPTRQMQAEVDHLTGETCRDIARVYQIAYDVALSNWLDEFPALSQECQDVLSRYSICLREAPAGSSTTSSNLASSMAPSNTPSSVAQSNNPSSMVPPMSSSSFPAGSSVPMTITTTVALNTTLTYTLGSGSSTRVTSVIVTRIRTAVITGSASSSFLPSSSAGGSSSLPVISSSVPIISSSAPSWSKYVTTSLYSTKYAGVPSRFLAVHILAPMSCDSTQHPPAATQAGIVTSCTEWYIAQPGDYCYSVAQTFGISVESFMTWNPAVEAPTCQRLLAGLAYCVATLDPQSSLVTSPATPTNTKANERTAISIESSITTDATLPLTSASTASQTSSQICTSHAAPPAPTGSDTVQGCTQWYIAQLGDSCFSIANAYHLSTQTFMDWNPSVEPPRCLNLLAGNAYCVDRCDALPTSLFSSTATTTATINSILTTTFSFSSTTYNISATATVPVSSSAAPSFTTSPSDQYISYCGDGSAAAGWPSESDWLAFDYLFDYNRPFMQMACQAWGVPDNSPEEIEDLRTSILSVSDLSGVDARFILATVMQESTGCVRVITSQYSHANPGLMQSFNGTGSCNQNAAPLGLPGVSATGEVWTPCPVSRIEQQILDGTNGTAWGPGLRQNLADARTTTSDLTQAYYRAARIYNGGQFVADDLSLPCCTTSYVSDIANRLLGWRSAARTYSCGGA